MFPDVSIPPKLASTWPKDFYVSTFNSRSGNYSISATDPVFPSMSSPGVVNTTVTLKSVSSPPLFYAGPYESGTIRTPLQFTCAI